MLADYYKKAGIKMVDAFGVEYPREFTDRNDEYHALIEAAGIIDLTHRHVLEVTGEDRASFLNAMLTNDVASLKDGMGCHALMTSPKGKIISELFVLAGKERHMVVVAQGDFVETVSVLEKHIISEDVAITDVSDAYGIIAIEGPKAGAVLPRVLRMGPLPKGQVEWVNREFDDFSVTVMNATATGVPGYHLIVPADHVARIRAYLAQAAYASGGLPVGYDAWETLRVENGLPWYGIDFTGDNFPQEVRLDHAVSYTKGCFRGQETLGRLHHQGRVNRVLSGWSIDADAFDSVVELQQYNSRALPDTPIFRFSDAQHGSVAHGRKLGRITSAAYSPGKEAIVFLAFIGLACLDTENRVVVTHPGGHAIASAMSFPNS